MPIGFASVLGGGEEINLSEPSGTFGTITVQGSGIFGASSTSAAAWGVTGIVISSVASKTFTDTSTASGATAASAVFTSLAVPTLAASNTTATTTNAATFYIAGAPSAGTNETITNGYGLWNVGTSRFDGAITVPAANPSVQFFGTTTGLGYNSGATQLILRGGNANNSVISASDFRLSSDIQFGWCATAAGSGGGVGGSNDVFFTRTAANILTLGGAFIITPSSYSKAAWTTTGVITAVTGVTATDSSTASGGTAASAVFSSIGTPTLAFTNTTGTATTAATFYIAGSPTAGTNATITNSYGLWNVGKTRLDGVTTLCGATATPASGSSTAFVQLGTTAALGIYYGSGAPTVSAAQGSLYIRSDGSSGISRAYINTTGSTTWTAITTVA